MLLKFALLVSILALGQTPATSTSQLPPQVELFLKTVRSEKIQLPDDSRFYNHYYRTAEDHPDAIVFLPGMGEPALKYFDLLDDLKDLNATVYLWDHLGQGFSYHFLPQESEKIYVDSFDSHIKVLKNFFHALQKKHTRVLVIGHSMGGNLALRIAAENPTLFAKLALSSPMTTINLGGIPEGIATFLLNWMPGTGYPFLYYVFKKQSDGYQEATNSAERLAIYKSTYTHFNGIKRTGATVGWIRSARASAKTLLDTDYSHLHLPVLLLQAEKDMLVSTADQTAICKKIPQCRLHVIKGSLHELLFEKEPVRGEAVAQILTFLKSAPQKISTH